MKSIPVTRIGQGIARQTRRYLGTGTGAISPSYPTWSFLSTIGGANAAAPGAPTGITRVPSTGAGDPRASTGYTNYSTGPGGTDVGIGNSTVNIGGSNFSTPQSMEEWLPIAGVFALLAFGLYLLLKK